MEVRHPSFMAAEYVALARRHGVATVFADSDDYPSFADVSADFVYARLMRCESACATGYPAPCASPPGPSARGRGAQGGEADGLAARRGRRRAGERPRDVFMFFISGAKERAPAAAVATLARGLGPPAVRSLIDRARAEQEKASPACAGEASGAGVVATRRGCGRTGRWRSRG